MSDAAMHSGRETMDGGTGATPAHGGPQALGDHTYDGIQEYDNPTPGWWHLIFVASVLFAYPYIVIYEMDPEGPTIQKAWQTERDREYKRLFAGLGELKPDQGTILSLGRDPKWMAIAESMFRSSCASCHGSNAEGSVGPNLTDDFYKNIKVVTDFPRVLSEGANGGAMPAWKGRLSDNEIVLLSAYAASLRGKNLPGPRGPEGERAAPWPEAPATQPNAGGAAGAGKPAEASKP